MLKATVDDIDVINQLLFKSFQNNKSVNYIVQQDQKRVTRIKALIEYSVKICLLFGDVLISEDRKACALLLYPQLKRTNLKSIILDINLITKAIGISGIKKAIIRESQVAEKRPNHDMIYLWFIGVEPDVQRQGIGTILLREILHEARKKELPVYLETSTVSNLQWYQNLGFEIYDKLELSYELFFLRYIHS